MEKWSFKKYKKPCLNIEEITLLDNRRLVIRSNKNEFDIEVKNRFFSMKKIMAVIEGLRFSNHSLWKELKCNDHDYEIVQSLLHTLDEHGLITEDECSDKKEELDFDRINSNIQILVNYILSVSHSDDLSLLERNTAWLIKHIACELSSIMNEIQSNLHFPQEKINDTHEKTLNFYLKTILYQAKYLKKSCPLQLLIWLLTLCRLYEHLHQDAQDDLISFLNQHWKKIAAYWIGGLFNKRDMLGYQTCLFHHLLNSLKDHAEHYYIDKDLSEKFSYSMPGINFMHQAERLADAALAKYGEPALLKTLSQHSEDKQALIKGIFIEEFHVTKRFVEMITPLLSKRLNEPLRERMLQYYKEEYGHEIFELQTCESLGIDKEVLLRTLPLPLTQAYVDAFTIIAEQDPIGFMISVMITEGMLGNKSPLHDYLAQHMQDNKAYEKFARIHDNVNIELNHASLSRLFINEIEFITPLAQQQSIRHFLYLLELNHRLLEELAAYYTKQKDFQFHMGLKLNKSVWQ